MLTNEGNHTKNSAVKRTDQIQETPLNESNYVDKAEAVMVKLTQPQLRNGKEYKPKIVTTSKIRNLLAMVSDIYNDVSVLNTDKLPDEIVGRINYMKIRFYYEAGREPAVKQLLDGAKVFDELKRIGESKKNYILFSRYMEALVAFRKYYGGSDD